MNSKKKEKPLEFNDSEKEALQALKELFADKNNYNEFYLATDSLRQNNDDQVRLNNGENSK